MSQLALSGTHPIELDVEPSLRPTVTAGIAIVVAMLCAFFGWSLYARLDSASLSQGTLVADSHRKTVQHLEGGILRELLVREGEVVKSGQILALLDTTQADSQLGQITSQLVAAQARIARLRAEQEGSLVLEFPPELTAQRNDPVVAETISTQLKLFQARWRAYESSEAVLQKRIDQLQEEIASNQSQLTAVTRRLALMEEERANVAQLLEKGFERRPRLLELDRNVADLKGRQGELRGAIARSKQAIGGAQLEIVNLGDTRLAEIARELQEARALEADLNDRIRAARDVRQRREVVSPQDGVVTDIRLVTPGGVIGPGQPLMDIVPVDDELIVETRVQPRDIDSVRSGLPARVRLTSYTRTLAPTVEATITYVAADMMTDQRTGDHYFIARARLSRESLAEWPEVRLYPGMPAEVMIVTGERRAIDYLVSPLFDRMRRAFHEK
ncbi:MAG TPA: HlyD family type I secretion periplasmic adaptor subunit [Alphaproteobacteria bacterium]|nr:HlyD family type I secretion periplasmic adaptor subunit [Alphaproteobacteria bacterium]